MMNSATALRQAYSIGGSWSHNDPEDTCKWQLVSEIICKPACIWGVFMSIYFHSDLYSELFDG